MMSNTMLRVLLAVTALLYYGALICCLLEKKHKWLSGVKYGCLGAAVIGNGTAIVNNYLHNGHVPFVSIFQVLIVRTHHVGLFIILHIHVSGTDLEAEIHAIGRIFHIGINGATACGIAAIAVQNKIYALPYRMLNNKAD